MKYTMAAGSVDVKTGVLRGVTVAKSGVIAQGKVIYLDKNGNFTRDADKASLELEVTTDEKTLSSLMVAVGAGGGKFKVRSDHDDTLAARAGYADNFQLLDDRVVCDIHLNESYRDREIVMEVSKETPELIGLSIDFNPTFDLVDGAAVMRVGELYAVDIVDAGAITPAGLFLNSTVDKPSKGKDSLTMATKTEEPAGEMAAMCAAMKSMTDGYAAMSSQLKDCLSKIAELSAPKEDKPAKDEAMAAGLAETRLQLSTLSAKIMTLEKEKAALGLRSESGTVAAAAGSPEADAAARAAAKPKTYLELVAEKKTEKLSASEAHRVVMKTNPEAYRAHLKSRGIAIPA